jgi:hypothetical protein
VSQLAGDPSPPVTDGGAAPPLPGTPAPGTLAPGTPAPGTPAPGTPAPGTPAPGTLAEVPLPAWVDPALRIVGAVVATGLGTVLALYGAFLLPLRVNDVRVPVSLVLALVGNPALVWFAAAVTGRRLAGLLPALAWCVVYLTAASRTAEGDLLLTSTNWVGLVTLVVGPLAFAFAIYGLVLRDIRTAALGGNPAPSAPASASTASAAGVAAAPPAGDRVKQRPVRPRRQRSGSAQSRRR